GGVGLPDRRRHAAGAARRLAGDALAALAGGRAEGGRTLVLAVQVEGDDPTVGADRLLGRAGDDGSLILRQDRCGPEGDRRILEGEGPTAVHVHVPVVVRARAHGARTRHFEILTGPGWQRRAARGWTLGRRAGCESQDDQDQRAGRRPPKPGRGEVPAVHALTLHRT